MTTNEMLFTALVVLNVIDVYTTTVILRQGGSELNKAMSWLMDKIGVIPALLVPKVVWHNFGQIKK